MNRKNIVIVSGKTAENEYTNPLMADSDIERILGKITGKNPILAKILSFFGSYSLGTYTDTFSHGETRTIAPREELIDVAVRHTRRLLGSGVAEKLRIELSRNPVILTGNHHCPNLLPTNLQGSILFALSKKKHSVVPVLACGDIPLNNHEYPRGIMTASGIKVSMYPDKEKHRLVSCTSPFTAEMVAHVCEKLLALYQDGAVEEPEKTMIMDLLQKEYLSKSVLKQKSFSDQTTVLNHALWKRLFASELHGRMPDMVYLELEEIVSQLLCADIRKKGSFFREIFFNMDLRNSILQELDGIYGCWDLQLLKELHTGVPHKKGVGTVFFWGIDTKGRRYSLHLQQSGKTAHLQGTDDSGLFHSFLFTPGRLCTYLKKKQVLPCLFTSYSAVAFVRGFKCYGGFMQTDYLTLMKHGLIRALKKQGCADWAEKIATVPTENYITGIVHTLTRQKNGLTSPSGAFDYIRTDGLTKKRLKKIAALTLSEGNLFGIQVMYEAVCREKLDSTLLQSIFQKNAALMDNRFLTL